MTAAFLGLEAALYAAFMTLDLTGGSGDPVKYASIAVCLVFPCCSPGGAAAA